MSTTRLPTDSHGDYYAGPKTAAAAAFAVLIDARETYAEDEYGKMLTRDEILVSALAEAVYGLSVHGYPAESVRLAKGTSIADLERIHAEG